MQRLQLVSFSHKISLLIVVTYVTTKVDINHSRSHTTYSFLPMIFQELCTYINVWFYKIIVLLKVLFSGFLNFRVLNCIWIHKVVIYYLCNIMVKQIKIKKMSLLTLLTSSKHQSDVNRWKIYIDYAIRYGDATIDLKFDCPCWDVRPCYSQYQFGLW